MGASTLKWRESILEKAQDRFERFVIKETLQDLNQIETRLRLQAKKIGDIGDLAGKAVAAEIENVQQLQGKLKALQELGRSNLRKQLAGEAGISIDVHGGIVRLSRGHRESKA